MIKYISFDLDGTLADEKFDKLIWHEEVPKLYARKYGMSLEEAKRRVYSDYYKALDIERVKHWTSIRYWFRRFGLTNWKQLLQDMKKEIFVYDDTVEALEYLSKRYKLIIISSSERKFFELKLEAEGIKKYFNYIFSAPNNFRITRNNREMYKAVLTKLKIKPKEMVHVGDDYHLDYLVPKELGIQCYHLVRNKGTKAKNTIHSLLELKKIL